MRLASLLCLCMVVFSTSALRAQQASINYKITGVVINKNNSAPIPHCHLTTSRTGRGRVGGRQFAGSMETGVDADNKGRFTISVPSAGSWRLVATAPGYTTQAYEEHEGYSSAIVLTEQAPAFDLQFRLPPEASLSGTVLDEAGEAVRNARVGLFTVPPQGPDNEPAAMRPRASTMTDDRGYYEFTNLPEGTYRVSVNARPWYASSIQPRRVDPSASSTANSLDPSLDVTYAETWYPGVDDPTQAETLTLKPGDTGQADFHLLPLPAVHLRVIAPPGTTTAQGRTLSAPPMVERVSSGLGNSGFVPVAVTWGAQGQFDISGLAPGLYQIRLPNQNQDSRVALVQVSEGGARTVDFTSTSDEANITIHFDRDVEDENAIQVQLTDADTGQQITQFSPRLGGGRPGRGGGRQQEDGPRERIMQVPPGRYEVMLGGRPDTYLTGMSAQSAEISGRFVKVHSGDASLTIHVGHGKASVTGIATLENKPVIGALVLLVPAGLGDPKAITLLGRDQTNTDGSFDLNSIVPGDYILVAIDNGWQINWKDPSTLNRYLIHGVPLELRPGATLKQNVEAQAP